MLRRVINSLKDFLFPIFCACGEEGVWLCQKCKRRINVRPFIFYPAISELYLGALVFFSYVGNPNLSRLIVFWKYNFAEEIKGEWEWLLRQNLTFLLEYLKKFDSQKVVYLVPVPLHPRRERERGFNQARILTNLLAGILQERGVRVEVCEKLKRIRYTSQQARLTPTERAKNLPRAFSWEGDWVPEQVVLIDDVFTTGTTARECARVLSNIGTKKIGVVVLAHG